MAAEDSFCMAMMDDAIKQRRRELAAERDDSPGRGGGDATHQTGDTVLDGMRQLMVFDYLQQNFYTATRDKHRGKCFDSLNQK